MKSDLIFDGQSQSLRRLFIFLVVLTLGIVAAPSLYAHQQPTTIALLDVGSDKVGMELQIPLNDLELAFGHDAFVNSDALIEKSGANLKNYLIAHVRPTTAEKCRRRLLKRR